MGKEIRFNEREMRDMIDVLRESARTLRNEVTDSVDSQAGVVDKGALLGSAGQVLSQSLRTTLNGKIDELASELERKADFVETELEQMLAAAQSS